MKQYVIDQLRENDYERIRTYLDERADTTPMDGIYWIDLPRDLYSDIQREHAECQPFYFAVNLNRRWVGFEWLIRSRTSLRCPCIAYATSRQRDFIVGYADGMLDELRIKL